MKTVFIFLLGASAFADEMPVWHSLPNEGKNCVSEGRFDDQGRNCGNSAYEVFTCIKPAADKWSPASQEKYLVVGEYGSDVANGCSPTFVVKKVIRAK